MQQFSIPTGYFPSTALFLDDNRDFLLNFVLQLDEGVAYRIFDNPTSALDYIHHKGCQQELLEEHAAGLGSAHPKLSDLHQIIYNPNRFAEISVVVVDYAMPGMNGLEFCRRIENEHIKKILLTGQADETQAIEAFNEGLIHRYIKKNDINAAEQITKSIYALQLQYFQAKSDTLVHRLPVTLPACLHDKKFASFFRELCEKNQVAEYYLLDEVGSFLLLDEDANTSFFLLQDEASLGEEVARAEKEGVDASLVQALAQGRKIPAHWQGWLTTKPAREWAAKLVPGAQIVADCVYYYALLQDNSHTEIRQQKILSYQRYLEELDAEALLSE